VTGRVTFTKVPISASAPVGLDYVNASPQSIRGAVIEARNLAGVTLSSSNTAVDGTYTLSAPANSTVVIVVKAALGSPAAPELTVVDNTAGGAIYTVNSAPVVTASVALTGVDFNAPVVFSGGAYLNQAGAPFAILDTLRTAQQAITAVATVAFPTLTVNWSRNNVPVAPRQNAFEADLAAGNIGTSFFTKTGTINRIFILGAEGIDTDEFDVNVLSHEWTHYLEANFGRSDSLGGGHRQNDILDETVAFGEGFANAMSGLLLGNNRYLDSGGNDQGVIQVNIALDADSTNDATTVSGTDPRTRDGSWSEFSVCEVIFDIADASNGDEGANALTLGIGPLFETLRNEQRTTRAFTTIFSFLTSLRRTLGNTDSENVRLLAQNEGIFLFAPADPNAEFIGSSLNNDDNLRYTILTFNAATISNDADSPPRPLGTHSTYSTNNKLLNRQLFRTAAAGASGSYTVTVTPVGADAVNKEMLIFIPGFEDGQALNFVSGGAVQVGAGTVTLAVNSGREVVFGIGCGNDDDQDFTLTVDFVAGPPVGIQ